MNSFFAYRLPGDHVIYSYTASHPVKGIVEGGFAICSFDPSSRYLFTIPAERAVSVEDLAIEWKNTNDSESLFPFPSHSTSRTEHRLEVTAIVDALGDDPLKKVVAARVILEQEKINPTEYFGLLCERYSSAFIFLFYTPQSGCWVGASPELLLRKDGINITTVALAGTRTRDSSGLWDRKNVEEQSVVTKYIDDVLVKHGVEVSCSEPYTAKAGPVEHIKTDISGILPSESDTSLIGDLLFDLSPTPALCGFPKAESLDMISRYEQFSRAFYGGFCGPVDDAGDFTFFVNLRSMWVRHDSFALFVGGGITRFSKPDSEWLETEKKKTTLMFSE